MNIIRNYITQSLQSIYPPGELQNLINIICRDVLKISTIELYSGKDKKLSDKEREELDTVLARLKQYEPIQYILGRTSFYGRIFFVNRHTLIPRPETEELVELVINENLNPGSILDIGTGSGCIAITLSLSFPKASVRGWDISPEALSVAEDNNRNLNANAEFIKKDVFGESGNEKYDIMVSNPPYVTEREKAEMEPQVLEWEPGKALFVSDDEPLLFYDRIAAIGLKQLNDGGRLYFEINRAYGKQVVTMLRERGYKHIHIIKDLSGNDRIIKAVL